jgi:hypothetical protein
LAAVPPPLHAATDSEAAKITIVFNCIWIFIKGDPCKVTATG